MGQAEAGQAATFLAAAEVDAPAVVARMALSLSDAFCVERDRQRLSGACHGRHHSQICSIANEGEIMALYGKLQAFEEGFGRTWFAGGGWQVGRS